MGLTISGAKSVHSFSLITPLLLFSEYYQSVCRPNRTNRVGDLNRLQLIDLPVVFSEGDFDTGFALIV